MSDIFPPLPAERPTRLTKRSFWNRFPQVNEVAMRAIMAQGSPALLAGQFASLNTRVESSPYVDVALQQTIDGVMLLASPAIPTTVDIDGQTLPLRLTAEQVAAILASPVGDEIYQGA